MNVLVLGYENSPLTPFIEKAGDRVIEHSGKISADWLRKNTVDFIVSFGYRYIITKDILDILPLKVINLHISYLPWNRGADPNLWSFLENTPKGVTLHYIDQGLDTGDIIAQREVFFDTEKETLKTSYEILYIEIVKLFKEKWPDIKNRRIKGVAQKSGGSSHKSSDKKSYEGLLTEKWDTPVRKLIGKAL